MERRITKTKPGNYIMIRGKRYLVTDVHNYFVEACDSFGASTTFSLGDLVVEGAEPSGGNWSL